MPVIFDRFLVKAPKEAVAFFHHDTNVLRRLTPPPVVVQFHKIEPLAEDSRSAFTLWFGPLPVHWLAVHSLVDPKNGFTDTQAHGPFKVWRHSHRWQAVDECNTTIEERIDYEHYSGFRGIPSRILFAPPLLKLMLMYRRWVIRRSVTQQNCSSS